MSQTVSAVIDTAYGVEQVCDVWEQVRSTFYDRRERAQRLFKPGKRGPSPSLPDADLLDLIRRDLAASPFQGEGHHKVRARLHFGQGFRVGRKRVLRLMRENRLLSPYRGRQGETKFHDGTIITEAPNLMWGTDGTKVFMFMLDDGLVWVFTAVEHWNAECVGWDISKHGDRYAALEPIGQGLTSLYGSVAAEVARGLLLRMDHGSQYLSGHIVNQMRFWDIKPCFVFVEQPQTNGVVERFNRALKEQGIYGKVLRNIMEARRAVGKFVEDYNAEWRVEKNGFVSPRKAQQAWFAALSQQAA